MNIKVILVIAISAYLYGWYYHPETFHLSALQARANQWLEDFRSPGTEDEGEELLEEEPTPRSSRRTAYEEEDTGRYSRVHEINADAEARKREQLIAKELRAEREATAKMQAEMALEARRAEKAAKDAEKQRMREAYATAKNAANYELANIGAQIDALRDQIRAIDRRPRGRISAQGIARDRYVQQIAQLEARRRYINSQLSSHPGAR